MLFTLTEDISTITYDEGYQIVEYKNGKIKKYKLLKHIPAYIVAAILSKSSFKVELNNLTYTLNNIPKMLENLNMLDLINGYNKYVLVMCGLVEFPDNPIIKKILIDGSVLAN